jgi:hypothetical protein
MKKLKRTIAVLTLAIAFVFGTAPMMTVRADGGPQGTSESKSKGPSTSGTSQADLYLLWLIILWLLGLL